MKMSRGQPQHPNQREDLGERGDVSTIMLERMRRNKGPRSKSGTFNVERRCRVGDPAIKSVGGQEGSEGDKTNMT